MKDLSLINDGLKQRVSWLEAILNLAAELSLVRAAVCNGSNHDRSLTDFLCSSHPEQQERSHTELKLGLDKLLLRVDEVLDLSNLEAGRFELQHVEFNLRSMVERVAAALSAQSRFRPVTVKTEIAPAIPRTVEGDPRRLGQILAHLLDGALDSITDGEITVAVTDAKNAFSPHRLHFAVIARGSEQPPQTRRRDRGELGSLLCQRLLHQFGGDLQRPDDRSYAFEIALTPGSKQENGLTRSTNSDGPAGVAEPRGLAIEQNAAPKTIHEAAANGAFRILVAEDSEDCRYLLEEFLQGSYTIKFAENGKQALEAALSYSFDLILMDIQMPVMDGITATRLIRQAEQQSGLSPTPLLALTGNGRKADIDLCLAVGCNAHVRKPVTKLELLKAIQAYLPVRSAKLGLSLRENEISN